MNNWTPGHDDMLLAAVAAAAISDAHDRILEHSAHLGRAGVMVRLRMEARELAASPMGDDQVKACAFEAAADDLAWGRAPLSAWRLFLTPGHEPSGEARAAIRAALPPPCEDLERRAAQAAADFEIRCVAEAGSAYAGARELSQRLRHAIALQGLLWDDPRIVPDPGLRLVMREAGQALQTRLAQTLPAPETRLGRRRRWRQLFG
jgi:hypothetical protein